MASNNGAIATGADHGDGLRKRPVPSSQIAPRLVEPDDDKKSLRKVPQTRTQCHGYCMLILFLAEGIGPDV